MNMHTSKISHVGAFKWLMLMPLALIGCYVGWFFIGVLYKAIYENMLGYTYDSVLYQFFYGVISQTAAGYIYISIIARMAPSHKYLATFIGALFGLFAIGFSFTPSIVKLDYMAMLGGISMMCGVFVGATEAQAKINSLEFTRQSNAASTI
jgi:uncharacterized membrane protein YfcA